MTVFSRIPMNALLVFCWSVSTIACGDEAAGQADRPASFPESDKDVVQQVFSLAEAYFQDFRHPETDVLYGARLSTKQNWTSPEDVKSGLPKPWGYGSRIADTTLHCGHLLVALLDAYEARPDPFLKQNIEKTFAALRLIGGLPETHPLPDKPALVGLVPRGPHPDDLSAYFDDSSMDQHTTYIISLSEYANSKLASEEEKAWIRRSLDQVGHRLEKHGWSIKQADGVTQAHVGFAWTGFNSDHASILLPAVQALYRGTGNRHWLEIYEKFLDEKDGLRWQRMHPGSHVRINGHPIYANQNAFRVHALFQMEADPARKEVLRGLLKQTAEMQCERDFPGPFYRRFHTPEEWTSIRKQLGWKDEDLHGCDEAWNAFRPEMLDEGQGGGGLSALAHVRFPLGGFHMVLLSEHPEMIQERLGAIWKMLNTVDLKKISAGETNYLFTVVALHTYAFYFRHHDLFAGQDERTPSESEYGKELPLSSVAGVGPTMDVTVSGEYAYAIGQGKLFVLDIGDRANPRVVGELAGLGHVRQIVVQDSVAYITSREDGLFVVSVEQPAEPRLLSHYDTIEFATGVAIAGDVLFVACRHYGVELIDVSDPGKAIHLSTVKTGEAQSVVARGDWLYVGDWATSEVVVVNIRNPRQPNVTSHVELDGFGDGVDVHGQYLYAATGHHSREGRHRKPGDAGYGRGHGLELFDLANPGRPTFVSRVKFPELYDIGHDMWSVTVAGDHAFVADTHNGIFVVDVSDPKLPRTIAHRKLTNADSGKPAGFVGGLAVTKNSIYVAGGATELHVVAASGIAVEVVKEPVKPPTIPPRVSIENPKAIESSGPEGKLEKFQVYRTLGQVHAVDFVGHRAVVACGSDGVHVIEFSPSVRRVSRFETVGFATDVAVSNEEVLIAAGTDGLLVCELSKQGELKQRGHYRVSGRAIKQVEVAVPGKYALLQVGAGHLHIVDISDPTKPTRVLDNTHHGLLYGDQLMRGLAENRYAALFWHVSGIHWYDMKSDPVPTYSGDNVALRIGAANGLVAYKGKTLATLRGGYALVDRDERRSLVELPVVRVGSRRHHLGKPSVFGDRLYAANRASGTITIADISDIDDPELIEQFDTLGNPGRVQIHEGRIVIPDGVQGLLVSTVPQSD